MRRITTFKRAAAMMCAGLLAVTSMPVYAGETELPSGVAGTVENPQTEDTTAQAAPRSADTGQQTQTEEPSTAEQTPETVAAAPTGETSKDDSEYIVVLPIMDGVKYTGIDDGHKSAEYSTSEDIVLLYTAGQEVNFDIETSYAWSVYNKKKDKDIVKSEDVKDGKVSFTMPADDLIVRYTVPQEETSGTEEKTSETASEINTEKQPETETAQTDASENLEERAQKLGELIEVKETETVSETSSETESMETESETSVSESQSEYQTEVQSEATTETEESETETEQTMFKVEAPDGDGYTMEVQGGDMHEAGEKVTVIVTPDDGNVIDEVTAEYAGNTATADASNTVTYTSEEEKPERNAEHAQETAREESAEEASFNASASDPVAGETAVSGTSEQSEAASVAETDAVNAEDFKLSVDDTPTEITASSDKANTATSYNLEASLFEKKVSFKMPSAPVRVSANARPFNKIAGLDGINLYGAYDGNGNAGKTFPVNYFEDGQMKSFDFTLDSVWLNINGDSARTNERVMQFLSNGKVVYTGLAYCLEPKEDNPNNKDINTTNVNNIDISSAVSKGMFYLYRGPAWGKTVNGINLKDMIDKAGVTNADGKITNGMYFTVTHYVLAYLYNSNTWNYQGGSDSHPFGKKSAAAFKKIADAVKSLPSPSTSLSTTSVSSKISGSVVASDSVIFNAVDTDWGKISLPDGVTLVIDGTGTKYGPGTEAIISAGQSFHFERSDGWTGTQGFTIRTRYPSIYNPLKVSVKGAQNLAFSYMSNGNLSVSVTWVPNKRPIKIRKTSSNTAITNGNNMYSLAGARFQLIGSQTYEFTINSDGSSNEVQAIPGSYTLREVSAPKGYKPVGDIPVTVVAGSGTQYIDVADVPYYGTLNTLLQKTLPDGVTTSRPMSDAEFTVKYYDQTSAVGTPKRTWVIKTLPEGRITTYIARLDSAHYVGGDALYGDNIVPLGTVTVQETKAPDGFLVNNQVFTYNISEDSLKVKTNPIENAANYVENPNFGAIKIRKADSKQGFTPQGDATFEGAVFEIISDNDFTVNRSDSAKPYTKGEVVAEITTDNNGDAQTSDHLLQAGTNWIIREKTPTKAGYRLLNKDLSITIEDVDGTVADKSYDASFIPEPVEIGGISIQKQDWYITDGNKPEGAASFAGAKFQIRNISQNPVTVKDVQFNKGDVITNVDLTTNADGYCETGLVLPYGTYEVSETKAPEGYRLNKAIATVEVHTDGAVEKVESPEKAGSRVWREHTIMFDVKINKFKDYSQNDDPVSDTLVPLEGAKFQIISLNDRPVHVGGKDYTKDQVVAEITTDKDGVATTKRIQDDDTVGTLPYGKYKVHESYAPENLKKIADFEIDGTASGQVYDGKYYDTNFKNDRPIESPIQIDKVDTESGKLIGLAGTKFQILESDHKTPHVFKIIGSFIDDVDTMTIPDTGILTLPQKLPYGTYYIHEVKAPEGYVLPKEDTEFKVDDLRQWGNSQTELLRDMPQKGRIVVEKKDAKTGSVLAGAVFSITAAETIKTADGTVHYEKGAEVGRMVTGQDGIAKSGLLYLGKYKVQEISAPRGFMLNATVFDTELKYQGQEVETFDGETITVTDLPTEYKLDKVDADNKAMPGVTFKLQRIGGPDSEGAAFDKAIAGGEFVTGKDGTFTASYIVSGLYSLTETKTLPGFVLDKTPRYFIVDENGHIAECDSQGKANGSLDKNFLETTWKNFYTNTEFYKTDVVKKLVAGAKLKVVDKDGNIVRYLGDDNVSYLTAEWTSSSDVKKIKKLPVGDFTLIEESVPSGYVKASPVHFTVKETSDVQKYSMIDKQLFVTKTDVTGDKEVPGAKLVVKNTDGKTMDEWTSTDKPHAVSGLEVGKTYTLTETLAPKEYVRASTVTFKVEDDGKNQVVRMVDKQLLVTKTDVTGDREIPGATLAVTGKDGKVVDEWVSTEKPHYVSGLVAGESYTLKETVTPKEYVRATEIQFRVLDDGKTQTVHMVDKQLVVSKTDMTGDREIPGAKLTITDKDGKVVDEWTSTEKPHYTSGLEAGASYTLTETTAPDGFVRAESIKFTVKDDGKIQTVSMKDKQVTLTKLDITGGKEIPGASITVKDKDGRTVDEWVSEEKPHAISGLEDGGTYTLTETTAPEGFSRNPETIEFSVMKDSGDQHLTMKDRQVFVTKTDITNGQEIPGAHLSVTDKDGNVVDEWTSTENPHPISGIVDGEKYTLTETKPADGFVTAESIQFTVDDELKENQVVEMKDDITKVDISKQEITGGKEIPGAHLVIKDKDGNVVAEWDSTETPHYIERIPIGSYTLTETKPADGYVTAETISFEVKDTPEIQHVKMYDDVTKVEISKQDITTKEELPGAKLVIRDKDGKTVETWVSTDEPHYIEKLPIGDYTLTEITAPNGYQKAETVKFTVKDTGEIQHVVMYDSPIPPQTSTPPKTSDPINPMLPAEAGAAAALLAAGLVMRRKKKEESEKGA